MRQRQEKQKAETMINVVSRSYVSIEGEDKQESA